MSVVSVCLVFFKSDYFLLRHVHFQQIRSVCNKYMLQFLEVCYICLKNNKAVWFLFLELNLHQTIKSWALPLLSLAFINIAVARLSFKKKMDFRKTNSCVCTGYTRTRISQFPILLRFTSLHPCTSQWSTKKKAVWTIARSTSQGGINH